MPRIERLEPLGDGIFRRVVETWVSREDFKARLRQATTKDQKRSILKAYRQWRRSK